MSSAKRTHVITAALTTVLGTMIGLALPRLPPRANRLLGLFFLLPMIVPAIITAVALYRPFAQIGPIASVPGLILAHTILALPFVVINVAAVVHKLDWRIVDAASRLFPHAILHWEDFGTSNARRILDRYRPTTLTFNDDMQGTGAVALAAILSATDGVIVFAARSGGLGNLVVVESTVDGAPIALGYAHIRDGGTLVTVGQHVQAGQQIAEVGTTGYSTGTHLHFELRYRGRPVDPHLYLP